MNQPARPVVKTRIQGTYKPRKRRRLLIILLVIVLIVGGFYAVKHIQKDRAIVKERMQYSAAEADLNGLADQIVAKFGKPADRKQRNYCGYTSSFNEFAAHGDLYCNETVSLVYAVTNKEGAIELTRTVAGVIKVAPSFRFESSSNILADSAPPPTLLSSSNSTDQSKLECNFDNTYFVGGMQDRTKNPNVAANQPALEIDLSCGSRPAKAAYFPVSD